MFHKVLTISVDNSTFKLFCAYNKNYSIQKQDNLSGFTPKIILFLLSTTAKNKMT
ncbi:hypothetical protein LKI01_13190 [Companilactobacillus paralimentarius]|nr:hypothetical protein LKI01_13190 [Companilactobacillus paralimentarius]